MVVAKNNCMIRKYENVNLDTIYPLKISNTLHCRRTKQKKRCQIIDKLNILNHGIIVINLLKFMSNSTLSLICTNHLL